jgi:peroxin-6
LSLSKLFIDEIPKIIRSSMKYHFNQLSYQVLMTNPVQQGYMVSSERTKVLVMDLSGGDGDDQEESQSVGIANHDAPMFNMLNSTNLPNVIEPQEFSIQILQKRWPEARLYPAPQKHDDDENRVFIDIHDLAKCGVFSGDWVLVSANDSSKSRLCRLFGIDNPSNTK